MYERVRLGYYPEGRRKAFTLSFDDGMTTDIKVVEILNKLGVKGTFHLNAGRFGMRKGLLSAEEAASLYVGHEVSCHSFTHPSLNLVPEGNLVYEILEDRRQLEGMFGTLVRGISYPNGAHNEHVADVLRTCGIQYARTCKATGKFGVPDDFMFWHPTTSFYDPEAEKKLKHIIGSKVNSYLGIYYWWTHSCDIGSKDAWADFESLVSRAVEADSEIWVATNIEICDYVTALRQLQISADQTIVRNPSCLDLWIEVGFDNPVKIPAGQTVKIQ